MKTLIVFLVSLSTSAVAAQETNSIKNDTKVESKSKERGRYGKSLVLSTGLGIRYSANPSERDSNVQIGYFLDKKHLLMLSYYSFKDDFSIYDLDSVEDLKVVELGLKKYFSRSFFIAPHIYFSNYKNNWVEWRGIFSTTSPRTGSYQRDSLGFGLSIGNQWNWEYLSFGITWLGLNSNVLNTKEDGQNNYDEFGDRMTLNFLEVNLGLTF